MNGISPVHKVQELLDRICAALKLHEWDHIIIDVLADEVWLSQVKLDGHEVRFHRLPGVVLNWEARQDEILTALSQLAEQPSLDGLETFLAQIAEQPSLDDLETFLVRIAE